MAGLDDSPVSGLHRLRGCAAYIVVVGLTLNGQRDREQMTPGEQAQYDCCVFGLEVTEVEVGEARRLYREVITPAQQQAVQPQLGSSQQTRDRP
jgi:hypothetical protein